MMGDDAELREKVKNYASDDTNLQYIDIERFEKKKMDTESYIYSFNNILLKLK